MKRVSLEYGEPLWTKIEIDHQAEQVQLLNCTHVRIINY